MGSIDSASTNVVAVVATLAVVATVVAGASGAVVNDTAATSSLDGTDNAVGHDTDGDCIELDAATLPDDEEDEDDDSAPGM